LKRPCTSNARTRRGARAWRDFAAALVLCAAAPALPALAGQAKEFVGPEEPAAAAEGEAQESVRYQVELEGVDDAALLEILQQSSQLIALADKPPATTVGLRRRAEADVERLQTALRSEGYYDGKIDLAIDTDAEPAAVRLQIDPGPRYRLAAYEIGYNSDSPPPEETQPALGTLGIELGMAARAPVIVDGKTHPRPAHWFAPRLVKS